MNMAGFIGTMAGVVGLVCGLAAGQETPATDPACKPAAREAAEWTVRRVGGDLKATIERQGDNYYAGRSRITTPLPVGYPDPTPPGAIDLKKYPSIRRAQISGEVNADIGMNVGFFPLFNHIKKREIAMTSPVEMDYAGLASSESQPQGWTMSFLYRTPELGDTGKDKNIEVVDTQPMLMLSVGLRGVYGMGTVQRGMQQLEGWLAANPGWERVGDARALYYNGPEARSAEKWCEVQVPVQEVAPAAKPGPAAAAGE